MSEAHTVSVARLDKPASVAAGPRTRGGYYWHRGPLEGARPVAEDTGGYLNSDGSRFDEGAFSTLRVYPCHEFKGNHGRALIEHTGWYSDDDGCRELMYGIVARLPHGRGFLAGWTMGAGMCATLSRRVHDDERSAVYAADNSARDAAEMEREYQRKWRAARDVEEHRATIEDARAEHSGLATELRAVRRVYGPPVNTPRACAALRAKLASERGRVSSAVRSIRALVSEYGPEILTEAFQ